MTRFLPVFLCGACSEYTVVLPGDPLSSSEPQEEAPGPVSGGELPQEEPEPTDEECVSFYDEPPRIGVMGYACEVDQGIFWFMVQSAGWTGEAALLLVSTDDPSPRAEEHVLPWVQDFPCGAATEFKAELLVGGDYVSSVSTAFPFDDHLDVEAMTIAYAMWDEQGNFVDCSVLGHDPIGLVRGKYDAHFTTPPSFDLADCWN